MKHILTAVATACLLSGCGGERFVGRPDLTFVEQAPLPPPTRQDLILEQRSYVIGPLDKVVIDVYGAPEFSRSVQVDATGTIALPLIGTVDAVGRTTNELAQLIADRLRARYMRDPQVTVQADTNNQQVTVDGDVEKPGMYPINGRMTLMRSIAVAEGVTDFADTSFVIVYRRVDNKQMAALYDLRAIRMGIYGDPEIFANDIVYVGESSGRRIFQTVVQGSGLLIAPLVALINR